MLKIAREKQRSFVVTIGHFVLVWNNSCTVFTCYNQDFPSNIIKYIKSKQEVFESCPYYLLLLI